MAHVLTVDRKKLDLWQAYPSVGCHWTYINQSVTTQSDWFKVFNSLPTCEKRKGFGQSSKRVEAHTETLHCVKPGKMVVSRYFTKMSTLRLVTTLLRCAFKYFSVSNDFLLTYLISLNSHFCVKPPITRTEKLKEGIGLLVGCRWLRPMLATKESWASCRGSQSQRSARQTRGNSL